MPAANVKNDNGERLGSPFFFCSSRPSGESRFYLKEEVVCTSIPIASLFILLEFANLLDSDSMHHLTTELSDNMK